MSAEVTFSLPSNDGWNRLSVAAHRRLVHPERGPQWSASIAISGRFWSREEMALGAVHDLVDDFSIRLHQVLLQERALESLRSELDAWLVSPFDLEARISGPDSPEVRLRLDAAGRSDSACSKPHFSFMTKLHRVPALEVRFTVDPSCVRQLRDGIAAWLDTPSDRP